MNETSRIGYYSSDRRTILRVSQSSWRPMNDNAVGQPGPALFGVVTANPVRAEGKGGTGVHLPVFGFRASTVFAVPELPPAAYMSPSPPLAAPRVWRAVDMGRPGPSRIERWTNQAPLESTAEQQDACQRRPLTSLCGEALKTQESKLLVSRPPSHPSRFECRHNS